ncbi:MBL fold metallo-hydrolase [Paenibacillus glufosinatiresistens]|uniref:MBL fold metallo-hydrolase n=1 Tax=Paenibacillus glufosinatiresistens TaxID=3070657 RepID=UPI00286DCDC8|nr:MBL fold metallo-hydrolase [Paenibacillus sp. YX.27]
MTRPTKHPEGMEARAGAGLPPAQGERPAAPAPGEVTAVAEGIRRLSVPMLPPLRQVNAYLLAEPDGGISVVDPGPRSPEAEAVWDSALAKLGLVWRDIRQVMVTHHHPDHYGLAGLMQSRSGGCPVYMSARAAAEADLMWGPAAEMDRRLPAFFRRHGMPEEWTSRLAEHLAGFVPQVTPQPDVTTDALPPEFGGRKWRVLETGGHAPGHRSFFSEADGLVLCGDAVLPRISPNVSLLPGSDAQPLLRYLDGLRELGCLPALLALPGHREPFHGFAERTASLLRHHEERLDETEALLAEGPRTGWEVCGGLFPPGRAAGIHQLRFAMSETLAHLAELVRRGRAEQAEGETVFFRLG